MVSILRSCTSGVVFVSILTIRNKLNSTGICTVSIATTNHLNMWLRAALVET